MSAIPVHPKIFELLKQAYLKKFGGSPSLLIKHLNNAYSYAINTAQGSSGNLISDKTIRNFFSATTPPTIQEKNLNYLCGILLKCNSYQDALEKFEEECSDDSKDWLSSYKKTIRHKCGTMQVLDMTQSVELDTIYTEVMVQKRRRKQRSIEELLKTLDDIENQNNISRISQATDIRIKALEAVKQYRRLLVLGLPGCGKTTFLKFLALQFSKDESSDQLIPIYIPLRELVETEKTISLLDTIKQEFYRSSKSSALKVQNLLEKSNCLILLDGLDEVGESNIKRVTKSIEDLINQFPDNHFIITCRIAASEYVFKDFTVVEIADFEREQIENFVNKWFTNRQKPEFGKKFLDKLRENLSLQELTTNPLLLTILCLLFEHGYNLSKNRYALYEDSVRVLLERWDATRLIERKHIYHDKLTLSLKINLFAKIAYEGFIEDPPKQFWRQWELEEFVRNFLQNISGVEPEKIQFDSLAVLRAIESSHGILVEQANKLYSFSHLTFQEYFTAQYVFNSILNGQEPDFLRNLIKKHLIDRRWKEVFIIIAGRLSNIDNFLKIIFDQANAFVRSEDLQQLLRWLYQKTQSSEVQSSSWRAFYLAVSLDIDLYISHEVKIDRDLTQKLGKEMRKFNLERKRIIPRSQKSKLELYIAIILTMASQKNSKLEEASEYTRENVEIEEDPGIDVKLEIAITIAREINYVDFVKELTALKNQLPSHNAFEEDWQEWTDRLRSTAIKYLDIGHRVILSKADTKALEDYIYTTALLLECAQGDSYSSREIREQIIDNLFLPIELIPPSLFPAPY